MRKLVYASLLFLMACNQKEYKYEDKIIKEYLFILKRKKMKNSMKMKLNVQEATMKGVLAIILVLAVLLIAGCAKNTSVDNNPDVVALSNDLNSIDSLDQELNATSLDDLDQDLDLSNL